MESTAVRRLVLLFVVVLVLAAGAFAWTQPEIQERVRRLTRVSVIEVRGLERLTYEEAITAMGISDQASVMDPPATWAENLEVHPLVRRAEVVRRPITRLRVVVEEREPVALVPSPVLVAVDAEGIVLPIAPGDEALDLPIAHVDDPRSSMVLRELGRLADTEVTFFSMVSEAAELSEKGFAVRLGQPPVTFLLPYGKGRARVDEGVAALGHAISEGRIPMTVDLRFAGLVVLRHPPNETRLGSAP